MYDNRAVQESVTKSNFSVDFIYLEAASLNISTLQLISSRVPTAILTRLSIKRNSCSKNISSNSTTACNSGHVRGGARCAREIAKNFLSHQNLRSCARRRAAWRASSSRRNIINDVHFRELDFRLRQRVPPFVSPHMKEHVGEK